MEELSALNEEYKETIDLHTEKTNDYAALLEESANFDFNVYEILIDNIPDTFQDIKLLMDFNILK